MKMLRITVILIFLGAVGYWYWTTTPEYSIRQVKAAVKNHDLVAFQKYVDMDSVASGIVDDLLTTPMRSVLGPGIFGQWIMAGVVGILKQPLVAGVKQDMERFVVTGQLMPKDAERETGGDTSDQRFSLEVMDSRLGFRKHAFRRIDYAHKDGKICTLGLIFHNQVYNQDLLLEVKMQDYGGYWRIVQISNFPKLTARLVELQASGIPEKVTSPDGKEVAPQTRL
ncbi:MAG: hypothetical protein C5B53_10000 [Candidatus Melainabacteria bacterium]|nr:MAG: hypothetical protein C5B53_10000 [Candidatus Melainabacteria bacterium]